MIDVEMETRDRVKDGTVAGGVATAGCITISVIISASTILCFYMKKRKKQEQIKKLQNDILARYIMHM